MTNFDRPGPASPQFYLSLMEQHASARAQAEAAMVCIANAKELLAEYKRAVDDFEALVIANGGLEAPDPETGEQVSHVITGSNETARKASLAAALLRSPSYQQAVANVRRAERELRLHEASMETAIDSMREVRLAMEWGRAFLDHKSAVLGAAANERK